MSGLFVTFIVTSISLSGCSSPTVEIPMVGKVVGCQSIPLAPAAGALEFPCMDGKSSIHFAQMRGPLIVNVWGSWCGPCQDEIPIFRSFYAKWQSKIGLVGIDVEEAKPSDGSNFVITHGMTWPILVDPDGRSRGFFGMGVPVTWFIDAEGMVVHKKIGVLNNEEELTALANKYLHFEVSQ